MKHHFHYFLWITRQLTACAPNLENGCKMDGSVDNAVVVLSIDDSPPSLLFPLNGRALEFMGQVGIRTEGEGSQSMDRTTTALSTLPSILQPFSRLSAQAGFCQLLSHPGQELSSSWKRQLFSSYNTNETVGICSENAVL